VAVDTQMVYEMEAVTVVQWNSDEVKRATVVRSEQMRENGRSVGLDGVAPQPAKDKVASFLELPALGFLECVWCEEEAAAAEDLHHEEGDDDLDVVGQWMGRELDVVAANARQMGGDES